MTDKPKKKQGFAAHPENINKSGSNRKGFRTVDFFTQFLEAKNDVKDPKGGLIPGSRCEVLLQAAYRHALNGDAALIKMFMEYRFGKPIQPISNDDDKPFELKIIREIV